MQLSHVFPVRTVVFDDPTLVSRAGLVPAMALARRSGLAGLADRHLTVAGGPGHAAGLKVSALVAGMVAGADSIADMAVLRHGGMGRLFTGSVPHRRWARFCGRCGSGTSGSWTRSPPGS